MVEVSVQKAAHRLIEAWEAATRRRLDHKPPDRWNRSNVVRLNSSPEKFHGGMLVVGAGSVGPSGWKILGDADRLQKMGESTGWFRDRRWPAGAEVSEVQRLGLALTSELSAGAGRTPANSTDPKVPGVRELADAIGAAVGRSHYPHVVAQLAGAKVFSAKVEQALLSGNSWEEATARERLVRGFAEVVDPVRVRSLHDGPLLDRLHTSEKPDKARAAAEILVNRSPVLQQAGPATRTAAIEMLRETIHTQLGSAIDDLDRSSESGTEERAEGLGRRIGEDIKRTVAQLEADAAPQQPDAETARTAETDSAAASRLAGEGVAGAGTTVPATTGTREPDTSEAGVTSTRTASTTTSAAKAPKDRRTGQSTTLG